MSMMTRIPAWASSPTIRFTLARYALTTEARYGSDAPSFGNGVPAVWGRQNFGLLGPTPAGPGSSPSQITPRRTTVKPTRARVWASRAVNRRPGSFAVGVRTNAGWEPRIGPTQGCPAAFVATDPPPHLATRLTP